MDLSIGQSVAGSLVLVAVLACAHLFAARLRRVGGLPESAVVSLAGGVSIAYVFLHLLPEVTAGSQEISEALSDVFEPTFLHELAIFLVALTGFVAFYGLERLAERGGSPRGEVRRREPSRASYAVHVGAFALYNAIVTYTLPLRLRSSIVAAVLYTIAIGVHVIVMDRGLTEHYARRFQQSGRFILAGSLVIGWALAGLAAPTSILTVSLITAAIAGTMLLTVFKEELPAARRSRFSWFMAGLLGYAVLLGGIALAEGGDVGIHDGGA